MSDGTTTTAPLTRAQKFQWFLEKGLAEGLRPLPDGTDEATAQRLVHALEARFEILRTWLSVVDGELRQVIHPAGSPVRVVDVDPDGTVQQSAADQVREFVARVHGRTGRFLVQFHLLRQADRRWLAVVADNVAVDAGFHGVLDQAITELLGGRTNTPATDLLGGRPGIQPAEQARREHDPAEDTERAEALDYLRAHFAAAPPRLHPHHPPRDGEEGRYYRSTLTLPHADRLFARAVAHAGLLPSAVVLAAFAQLLCGRADAEACTVNVSLDNRHNAELRRVLCATAQRSPVALPGRSRSLLEAAEDVQQTLAAGHPVYGRYDPFDLIDERAQAQRRRGVCLSTDLAFNFIPPPQGWAALLAAENDAAPGPGSGSTLTWAATDETRYEYGVSLSVRWADPHTVRLSVHGDSEVLAPDQCAALLRGIELVLTRIAAGQDSAPEAIAAAVGLLPLPRGPRELRSDGRWIDLGAIEDRLRAVAGVATATALLAPGGPAGAPGPTARVVPADDAALTPLDLWEALLRAVRTGELLAVPDRIELAGATGLPLPPPTAPPAPTAPPTP